MRFWRVALSTLGLLCAVVAPAADKAAIRALLRIPYLPSPIGLDLPSIRAERAMERLAKLNQELLSDRKSPRLNFRAGAYLREMGDPGSREYFRRAIDALVDAEKARPLDSEQTRLLIEALTACAEFDEAAKRLDQGNLDEGMIALYRGELGIFRVLEAAGVALHSPSSDRMLGISLEALRNPEIAPAWRDLLVESAKHLKRAAQLSPKDPRPHRSLSVALVAHAYVQSSILWRSERKTTSLMPEEAFAHFKEAANLAPEDVVAQWEAFESRVALERSKGAKSAADLPKEAAKFVGMVAQRLESVASSAQSDARLGGEVLAVVLAQSGKPEVALGHVAKVVGDPPRPRVQLLQFRILLSLGRTAEALPIGTAVLKEVFVPEIALEVSAAADVEGDTSLASSTIVEGLKRYPGSIELRLARAVVVLRDPEGKELGEAGTLLEGLASTPDDEPLAQDVKYVRALFYGLIGDTTLAFRILDQLDKSWADKVAKAKTAMDSGA